MKDHSSGKVQSTKSRKPFILLKTIECSTREEAVRIEKEMKKGYKREQIYGEVPERSNGLPC